MRKVILLHARQDAQLALNLFGDNADVALICAVDPRAETGRFGPQFHIAALWTANAEAAGLEDLYYAQLADRDAESLILCADGARVPESLQRVAVRTTVHPGGRLDQVFSGLTRATPTIDVVDPLLETERAERRRNVAAFATAALSLGAGALLAHAASPNGLIPASFEPTYTPTSRVSAPAPTPVEEAAVTARIEAVMARVEAFRAKAAEAADAPVVRARFETVRALSVSDALLAQMAARAETQTAEIERTVSTESAVPLEEPAPAAEPVLDAMADVPLAAAMAAAPLTVAQIDVDSTGAVGVY